MRKLSVKMMLDLGRENQAYRSMIQNFLPLPVAFVMSTHKFTPNQRFMDFFQGTEYFVLKEFLMEDLQLLRSENEQNWRTESNFQFSGSSHELPGVDSLFDYLEELYKKFDSNDIDCRPSKILVSRVGPNDPKKFFQVIIQKTFTADKMSNMFMLLFDQVDIETSQKKEGSLKVVNALAQAAHDLKTPCNNILFPSNTFFVQQHPLSSFSSFHF